MTRDEHLMVIGMEECDEVSQRLSKALRFGMEQIQQDADDAPEQNPERLTNRQRIEGEYVHLVAVMEMLGIPPPIDPIAKARKKAKVERYLLRSERCGTLADPSPAPSATKKNDDHAR